MTGKSRVVHCIGKANIDGELTITEDLSMLAPEGVETLLIGAGSPVTPVPETGVIIMYPEAKAPRVYLSLPSWSNPESLLKVGGHDEVPLDAPEIGLGAPDYHKHYLRN
jgi:hypothetical protein